MSNPETQALLLKIYETGVTTRALHTAGYDVEVIERHQGLDRPRRSRSG